MKKLVLIVCLLVMLISIAGCAQSIKLEGFAEKRQIGNNTDSVIGIGIPIRF